MHPLLQQLLDATKVRDITDVIEAFSREHRVTCRPVGDSENNLATINLGRDPAAGLVERITNAIDAILEREWRARGEPAHLLSPRSAVAQWFGIPEGKLSNIQDTRDPAINTLTERVQVTLRDSERTDRPTVDIRDRGIGIKADEFVSSILSLHGNRKLRKRFLAGAFGQGGSTALSYSFYTIIISRTSSQGPESNSVAVTIVRFNPGDPLIDKHGLYEYMADHATGHPFTFAVSEEEFAPGTLVRHIAMDLGKYKNTMTAPTGSLWYLTHHYLFDPVLPFRIEEERNNQSEGFKRTVAGNYRLLSNGDNTEYQRSASLTFRDGSVTISWWVLSAEGEQARNRITQYTLPSQPIVVTYNGQKQGELPNTIIKNDLRLPYLERYLVVHIDCDQLDNESRRQLFPTTRESLRDTSIMDDLRQLLTDTLDGDPELDRLDAERKQRYIRRSDSEAVDNVRRRLARRVQATVLSSGGGRSPRTNPPESTSPTTPRVPIPVLDQPTLLEITSPDPRRVYAGKRFTLSFRTDADPAYFSNPDSFIAVIDPPSFGQYTGTTNVRNGYGTAYFTVNEDLENGATANITFELRPRRATSLRSSIQVEVVPLPQGAGPGDGHVNTPNINPQWVVRDDPFWADNNWDDTSVAKVVRTDESVDVFVSAENRKLNHLISRAQRRDTNAVDSIKDFYLEHISFYALLSDFDQERLQNEGSVDGQPLDPEELGLEHERELSRACETICGIMEDMFDVLVMRESAIAEDSIGSIDANAI